MTKVIIRLCAAVWLSCLVLACGIPSYGQEKPGGTMPAAVSNVGKASVHPAEALYLKLRSVSLDPARVYHIRDASLDHPSLHVTLEDGTIAFTEDVEGRVTGAFFEGDGDVLLIPPDQAERASMALFTGSAIMEESFTTAYFRFNDDTFQKLQPALRPEEEQTGFVSRWQEAARHLAENDALRLLESFSHLLPSAQGASATPGKISEDDHLLHVHAQGKKFGIFDLYYDSMAAEQVAAGQLRVVHDTRYYDLWTSFPVSKSSKNSLETTSAAMEENIRADAVTIFGFKIHADVKPPTGLSVEASLQMQVSQGGQRAVLFELSRFLNVTSVEADGHTVEFIHNPALEGSQLARRGNDLMAVVFPEPLLAGQKIELHFTYGGQVLSEAGGGLLYVGARGTWYPNHGIAMANFDLEFHYPAGWTLVATGKRVDVPVAAKNPYEDPATAEQVSRWVSERPIPIAGFNLGKYTRVTAQAGSVSVETYVAAGVEDAFPKVPTETAIPLPATPRGAPTLSPVIVTYEKPSPARSAQQVADTAARAMEFFSQQFGPYPYSSLKLAQMPGAMSQGWPSLIFLSSFSFLSEGDQAKLETDPAGRALNKTVVAHETAHQWWGDLVSWSGYRDQWMMEALADYSALMLLETEDPSQFRAALDKYREDLLRKNTDGKQLMNVGPVILGVRLSSSHFPRGYEAISYGRGTWLLHMLRGMMLDAEAKKAAGTAVEKAPEDPFLRTLRKILARYEGKKLTTREMLKVFEEDLPPSLCYESRKSLDWFYEGWVQGTAIPQIELQGVRYTDNPNATVITGRIVQKDAPKDLVTPVPFYAALDKKTVLLGRVFADGPETHFRLTAPLHTRKVILDPNQTLLARIK